MATQGSKPDSQNDDLIVEDDSNGFDFDEEHEQLTQGSQWFDPEPGTHEVTFLDNGEPGEREYDGEIREVGVFTVEVDGEELKWSVTKAQSEASLWGQLMKYGAAAEGLKGETITLIRSGEGTDTTYTVQEAADI